MKITINLTARKRNFYYGETVESYLWSIKVPRGYVSYGFNTRGQESDFNKALDKARRTVEAIYEFNEKKRKFPYKEDYTP